MNEEANALDGVVDIALDVVSPLVSAAQDELSLIALLNQIGWSTPGIDLVELRAAVNTLVNAVDALRTELSFESLEDLAAALGALVAVGEALTDLAGDLAAAVGGPAADADALATAVEALGIDLLQHLSLLYVGRYPAIYAVLELLGLVDDQAATALSTGGEPPLLARAPVVRPVLAFDVLGDLVSDPLGLLTTRLGAQRLTSQPVAEQVTRDVFDPILRLVTILGGTGVAGTGAVEPDQPSLDDIADRCRAVLIMSMPSFPIGGPPVVSELAIVVDLVHAGGTSRTGDAGPGFLIVPEGSMETTAVLAGSEFGLTITGGGFTAWFPADGPPVVHGGDDGVTIELTFRKLPPSEGAPALAFGADTAKLTVQGLTAGVHGRFGRSDAPELHFELESAVESARFMLAPAEGDGFLSKVLPADGIGFDFDLGIGWSNTRGVYFTGAAGLQADLPLNVDLFGLVTLDVLHLGLAASGSTIAAHVATTATLTLGPFTATVQRVGLAAELAQRQSGGNLGPLDVLPRFLPPNGAGLAIETPAVSGGGFLSFDADVGRYAGVFELTIVNTVSVKVIGIITTKLADGSAGFALLLIITAEGFTPIQLGMGFALTGVGGLLALNRSIDVDVVRDGLRSGVLDSVLFVKDPVKNAPRILATLDRVFPLAVDRLLIGPLAEISWGTPALVKIRLALLLEIPQPIRVVLLAAISVALPDEKKPVVQLHVDAVGVLDFGRGELALDASLHDSRILDFTLTGDMALRLNWGDAPTFLLSVGGFHPKFTPPAGLRPLNRLALTLTDGENPRIRFETYLALTSNTIQMGARVELYVEYADFGIDGGGGFDALVQWSPFSLEVAFDAWVRIFGPTGTLLAARVAVEVTGPQPWHVTGVAEVAVLSISAKVPIDFTIGQEAGPAQIETVDVVDLLWKQVGRQDAWEAVLPAADTPGVTLSTGEGQSVSAGLVIHPLSTLSLRQKVVPLATSVSRVGAHLPVDGTREYHVDVVAQAGVTVAPLEELFAPGMYEDVSEDEKLSGAAFRPMHAGLTLSPQVQGSAADAGVISTDLTFESKLVTGPGEPLVPGPARPAVDLPTGRGLGRGSVGPDRSQMARWTVVPA